jgi:hypothetical protein
MLVLLLAATACSGRSWSDRDAHRRCAPAIDAWPGQPAPPCEAMSMCLNEAALDPAREVRLRRMMRAGGCAPP